MNKTFPQWINELIPCNLKSDFSQTSFGKIHYLSGGEGQSVLFLHGNPTWSFIWRKIIAKLDLSKFQVHAPDLLNLGFSDGLTSENLTLENQAQALVEFVNLHKLDNITLVVQDWGGPIGLFMSSLIQEKISKLVILNTGLSAPKPPYKVSSFHSFVHKKIIPDILFKICRYPMYSLGKIQFDKESISGDVAKAYRYPIAQKKRWAAALSFARMVPNGPEHPSFSGFEQIEKFCSSFTKPVKVVWGTKDPILGRGLKRIKNIFPHAIVKEVEAGHFLQEECPDDIANAIITI